MAQLLTDAQIGALHTLYEMGDVWDDATEAERIQAVNTAELIWQGFRWRTSPFTNPSVGTALKGALIAHSRAIAETEGQVQRILPPAVSDLLRAYLGQGAAPIAGNPGGGGVMGGGRGGTPGPEGPQGPQGPAGVGGGGVDTTRVNDLIEEYLAENPPSGGGFVVKNVVDGRLPAAATEMRIGWSDTQTTTDAIFTRSDNHPSDGAAVGTVTGINPPVFPAALASEKGLYLFVWVAAAASEVLDLRLGSGAFSPLLGNGIPFVAYTYDGVDGAVWVSELLLAAHISADAVFAFLPGALILTDTAVEDWAKTMDATLIPADKLTNAPGGSGGGTPGATGPIGPTGPPGPTGSDGDDGDDGEDGDDGTRGAVGTPGTDGAAGPRGHAGPQGPEGPEGPEGPAGTGGGGGGGAFATEQVSSSNPTLRSNRNLTATGIILPTAADNPWLLFHFGQRGSSGESVLAWWWVRTADLLGKNSTDDATPQPSTSFSLAIAAIGGSTGVVYNLATIASTRELLMSSTNSMIHPTPLVIRKVVPGTGGTGGGGGTGPRGATGAQGPIGPAGDDGATGPRGGTGAPGPTGDAGVDGDNGMDGATGPRGAAGLMGSDGATGPRGLTGLTGPAGDDGDDGEDGEDGDDGAVGPIGPAGADGTGGTGGGVGIYAAEDGHVDQTVPKAEVRVQQLDGVVVAAGQKVVLTVGAYIDKEQTADFSIYYRIRRSLTTETLGSGSPSLRTATVGRWTGEIQTDWSRTTVDTPPAAGTYKYELWLSTSINSYASSYEYIVALVS